jgi:hypothetical protein
MFPEHENGQGCVHGQDIETQRFQMSDIGKTLNPIGSCLLQFDTPDHVLSNIINHGYRIVPPMFVHELFFSITAPMQLRRGHRGHLQNIAR